MTDPPPPLLLPSVPEAAAAGAVAATPPWPQPGSRTRKRQTISNSSVATAAENKSKRTAKKYYYTVTRHHRNCCLIPPYHHHHHLQHPKTRSSPKIPPSHAGERERQGLKFHQPPHIACQRRKTRFRLLLLFYRFPANTNCMKGRIFLKKENIARTSKRPTNPAAAKRTNNTLFSGKTTKETLPFPLPP